MTCYVCKPVHLTLYHLIRFSFYTSHLRTNFPMHGSITPVLPGSIGPLSMHVTLNRMENSSVNQDNSIMQSRTLTAQVQKDAPAGIQQRISVSLSSDSNLHSRLTPELARSTLPFSGPTKVTHPSLVPQPKVVSAQQGASIKTGRYL